MNKKVVIGIFSLCFILATFVSAVPFEYNPGIDLKATANQNIILRFKDSSTNDFFKTITFNIGSDGKEISSLQTNREEVNVLILVVKDLADFIKPENIISSKEVGPFSTSEVIRLSLRDNTFNNLKTDEEIVEEEVIEEINETEEVEEEETIVEEKIEEETKESSDDGGITGLAIIWDKLNSSSFVYLIVGIVVVAGFVLFFMLGKKQGGPSFSGGDQSVSIIMNAEERLKKATKELNQARSEINQLKEKDKDLIDAETQFRQARENLEKLKKAKEGNPR